MRGAFDDRGRLFSYISPEARVPANHPLRKVSSWVKERAGSVTAAGPRTQQAKPSA